MIARRKMFSYHGCMKKPFKVLGTGLLALGLVVSTPGISDIVGGNVSHTVEASGTVKEFNKKSALRASASSKAKAVLFVKPGHKAKVLRVSGSWTQVKVGTKTGWTPSRDLSVGSTVSKNAVTKVFNKKSAVRDSRSTKSKAVVFVKPGNKAIVLDVYKSWTKVKVGTKTGWVPSRDLGVTGTPAAPPATVVTKIFNKDSVVRSSASTKAKVLLSVKNGQSVSVLKVSGSWAQVKVGKVTGWTANRDLGTTLVTKAATSKVAFDLKNSRSSGSATLTKVAKGASIRLVAVHGSWSEVVANGKRGFVASRSVLVGGAPVVVAPTPTPTPTPTPKPTPVVVERATPAEFVKRVAADSRFKYKKPLNSDATISYAHAVSTADRLEVFPNKNGSASLFHWIGDAYAQGVSATTRNTIMSKQYASLQMSGDLLYGRGTKESSNYAATAKIHMVALEKMILADWHGRMRIYKEGSFTVNGDRFDYMYAGPGFEIWYK